MPKFPDRWFDYTNTGDVIQGTRLITFKVPLKESFFANNNNIPEDSRFTPETLLKCMSDKGLKLGLVIDLTFTNRYYDQEEFTRNGVQYKKIFVEGHVIPKKEVIESFYEAIDTFLESSEEGSLIGVHCTHGVNRTGYVVCRYMVEHLGMKATDALEAYKTARGYPVERVNYKNDLKRRAGEQVDEEEPDVGNHYYRGRGRGHHHDGGWNSMNGHHHGGGRNESHRNHENRGHHRNHENYENHGQYYRHDPDNWRNHQGQYWGQGAYENQYGPSGWNGYSANNWQQQQGQYQPYSDGQWNNYGRPQPPYRNSYNQYRGRSGYQRMQNSREPNIQYNGYSDNDRSYSYDRRNYRRQNSGRNQPQ